MNFNYNVSSLFSSLNSGSNSGSAGLSSMLSDYGAIRNGSYGKLLGGKPDRISDFCDTISAHQQWKTVLDPKRKQVIEYRHFHVFFKEPAAFAFADIYMVRNIVQTEIFHGMLLNVRHNTAETVQVF